MAGPGTRSLRRSQPTRADTEADRRARWRDAVARAPRRGAGHRRAGPRRRRRRAGDTRLRQPRQPVRPRPPAARRGPAAGRRRRPRPPRPGGQGAGSVGTGDVAALRPRQSRSVSWSTTFVLGIAARRSAHQSPAVCTIPTTATAHSSAGSGERPAFCSAPAMSPAHLFDHAAPRSPTSPPGPSGRPAGRGSGRARSPARSGRGTRRSSPAGWSRRRAARRTAGPSRWPRSRSDRNAVADRRHQALAVAEVAVEDRLGHVAGCRHGLHRRPWALLAHDARRPRRAASGAARAVVVAPAALSAWHACSDPARPGRVRHALAP